MKVFSSSVLISLTVVAVTSANAYGYKYNNNPHTGECRLQLNLPGYGDDLPPRRYGSPHPKFRHPSPTYDDGLVHQSSTLASRHPTVGIRPVTNPSVPQTGRFSPQNPIKLTSPPERRVSLQVPTQRPLQPARRFPQPVPPTRNYIPNNNNNDGYGSSHNRVRQPPPSNSYGHGGNSSPPPRNYDAGSSPVRNYANRSPPQPQLPYYERAPSRNNFGTPSVQPSTPFPVPARAPSYVHPSEINSQEFDDSEPSVENFRTREPPQHAIRDNNYFPPAGNRGIGSGLQDLSAYERERYRENYDNRFSRGPTEDYRRNSIG